MPSSRFFAAMAAYMVIAFGLGFVWHLKAFKATYDRLAIFSRLDKPVLPLGLLSVLIQGVLLAHFYERFVGVGADEHDAIHFVLLMGTFLASATVFAEAAKQKVTSLSTFLLLESAYYLVQFLLVGFAFLFIFR